MALPNDDVLKVISLCILIVFDGIIQFVASRIRKPIVQSIFKWSILCVSRFVLCGLPIMLSFHGFNSASVDLIVNDVLTMNTAFIVVFSLAARLLPYFWRKYCEHWKTGREDKWIWYRHELIIGHLLQQLSYANISSFFLHFLVCLVKWRRPYSFIIKFGKVNILGNDRIYDPAWPRCSIAHSIVVTSIPNDNRLLLIRTSFFRRQARVLWSYPMPELKHESMIQLKMCASENGGLILIFAKNGINYYLWIIHLGTGKMFPVSLDHLFPTPSFDIYFAMRDDGSEFGDDRNPSSIYVRLIYCDQIPGTPIYYAQSLIEVPVTEDGGTPRIVSIIGRQRPPPWDLDEHHVFQTSCGQMGIKMKHPFFGQSTDTILWEPSHKKLVRVKFADLVSVDRPLRLFMQRYPEIDQLGCIVPHVLNNGEAMVFEDDWSVWRTTFQPPSLKRVCLEKVFGAYKKELEKFDARKWMETTGVDAGGYFQGKK